MNKNGNVVAYTLSGIIVVVLLFAAYFFFAGRTLVEPGFVGIKYSLTGTQREIKDVDLKTGWVTFNPWTDRVIVYPNTVQRVTWTANINEGSSSDESITFQSSEGVQINADVGFSSQISSPSLVFTKYRLDFPTLTHGQLRDFVRKAITDVSSQYTVEQLVGSSRPQFEKRVLTEIQEQTKNIGIAVISFNFSGAFRLPPQVQESINLKIQATQRAIQAENELRTIQAEAKKNVAKAQGDAASTLALAAGQARANRELATSITPEYLKYQQVLNERAFIDKWDGKLPLVSGGSSITDARDLSSIMESALPTNPK